MSRAKCASAQVLIVSSNPDPKELDQVAVSAELECARLGVGAYLTNKDGVGRRTREAKLNAKRGGGVFPTRNAPAPKRRTIPKGLVSNGAVRFSDCGVGCR